MDKQVLEQLAAKKRAVKVLEKLIKKTQKDIDRHKKMIVSDTVKGTRPDGTYGPIKITGLEKKNLSRLRNAMIKKRDLMIIEKAKEEEKACEAEMYIDSMEDSDMKTLLRLRCIWDFTFLQISREMGENWGEDRCRKTFNNFMKE